MKRLIDRGSPLTGINRTSRDHRLPPTAQKKLENYRLPDGRMRRRLGYSPLHEPIKTQALAKHTSIGFSKRLLESDHNKGLVATTPLSYGLIRWQSEYQLRRAEAKTIEFCFALGDKDEYVKTPFQRVANSPGNYVNHVFRNWGVYLLDQTIISNGHIFEKGFIIDGAYSSAGAHNLTTIAAATEFDVLPITTLAFSYSETSVFCEFGMIDIAGAGTGTYWRGILVANLSSYNVGDIHHVALVYDPTLGPNNGRLSLYLDGVFAQKIDLPDVAANLAFAGEQDLINGVSYPSGQKRDFVLLNECTARASYSSACKIRGNMHGHQTFFHDFSNAPNTGLNPWALSPPRGTAMWDLRIWSAARSSSDINTFKFTRLNETATLIGNWWLNDGGPVCVNKVTGKETRYCTLHHSYPGYVNNSTLLNGLGVKLGEGQHLIKSLTDSSELFSGLSAKFKGVFDYITIDPAVTPSAAYLKHRDQNSFTVMMQLMVPDAFQPELNNDSAAALSMQDLALAENRRAMNTGCFADYDSLLDGQFESSGAARTLIGHANGAALSPTAQHLRAYDQTLWSIEGTQRASDTEGVTSENERRRIPVARGVLTPDGKVAFELFKANVTTGAQPVYFRLLSGTALTVGSVYTVTFVQKVNYVYDAVTNKLDASGWVMEIWLQNITAGTAAALSASYTVAAASTLSTAPLVHHNNYDISIGASYVNDGWDHSINMPFPGGVVATPKTSFTPAPSLTKRENHGPWPVQQRFMSPYQDQPGNFIVSMFRFWSLSLPDDLIKEYGNSNISAKDQTTDLLMNYEFDSITGLEIPNRSRYPDSLRMGYKGWGMPQGYREKTYITVNLSAYLKKELFEGTWAYEDCLGYAPIDTLSFEGDARHTRVNGIAAFKASEGNQFGLLAVYDDCIQFDRSFSGNYSPLYLPNQGLLSDLYPGLEWRSTITGDRTFLTSPTSLPKVFDGKSLTTAGLKRWSGGIPIVYETTSPITSGLTSNKWYGVALVYFAEATGTYIVSPVVTVKVTSTNAFGVYMVPHHPDARITLVEVYRTLPQTSRQLAAVAPLYKTRIGSGGSGTISPGFAGGNVFAETLTIDAPDAELLTSVVLDRNVTEFPIVGFSAAFNNRLFLAGDPAYPDRIYFTDPGNPERLDSFANSLNLPEGSGDAITGMVAEFGAVYVFKPNGIWRIDELGGNNFQLTRVSTVGAASNKSIQTIVNPDNGETTIFFWSQYGPYLFDGNSPRYIGFALEESEFEGEGTPEYHWLVPETVVAGHNPLQREIICFYVPKKFKDGVLTTLDRHGEAYVFNYRIRGWYKYTGVIGTNALSLTFTGKTIQPSSTRQLATQEFRLVTGGTNGCIYAWGTSKYDGLPSGLTVTQEYPITVTAGGHTYTVPTLPFTKDIIGLWATIVDPVSKEWITGPIVGYVASTTKIVLNEDWVETSAGWDSLEAINSGSLDGCVVYLCQDYARAEFVFDTMDMPILDKDVVEIFTWHNKEAQYRFQFNHEEQSVKTWRLLADGQSKRKRTQIKKSVEALKFEFASIEFDSTLDAYAYNVEFKEGANIVQ